MVKRTKTAVAVGTLALALGAWVSNGGVGVSGSVGVGVSGRLGLWLR